MNELRVVSGFHRGVALVLDENPIVIGSSLEADLVLTDPGILESHVKIIQKRRRAWRLTSLKGSVKNQFGENVKECGVVIDDIFNINGVWIQFARKQSPWLTSESLHYKKPVKRGMQSKGIKPIKVEGEKKDGVQDKQNGLVQGQENNSMKGQGKDKDAIMDKEKDDIPSKDKQKTKASVPKIIIFCIVGCIGVLTATHATVGDKKELELDPKEIASIRIRETIRQREKIDNLIPVFEKMLKERRLYDVTLVTFGDVWDVEGELEKEDIAKLKRMVIRFSKKNPHSLTINNNVVLKDHSLPFDIVKVISGPYGHVMASDGKKLYLGDEYKGVKLVSITKNKLTFSGKNNITINW